MKKRGHDFPPRWKIDPLDARFAKCVDAYQPAQHTPVEFRTRGSYRIFIAELDESFCAYLKELLLGQPKIVLKCDNVTYPAERVSGGGAK